MFFIRVISTPCCTINVQMKKVKKNTDAKYVGDRACQLAMDSIVKRSAAVGLEPRDKVQNFPRVVEFPSFLKAVCILLISKIGLN